jgi:hypothetical protein
MGGLALNPRITRLNSRSARLNHGNANLDIRRMKLGKDF